MSIASSRVTASSRSRRSRARSWSSIRRRCAPCIAEVNRLHKLGLSAEDAAKQANWGPYKEWYLAEQQGPIAVRKVYEEIEGKLK